jgi:phosphoglycerate dehydrogenase-like enzyme
MHPALALLLAAFFALAASAQNKTVLAPAVPDDWLPRLRADVPQVNLVKVPASEVDSHLADADGFIGKLTPAQLALARKLKWEQVMSAGVDDVLFPALVSSNVTLTNMKVVYGPEIADHAFAFLLAMTRRLNVTIPAQKEEKWIRNREGEIELNGKTAVIVGVGGIGRQIAQRAFGFGMKVIGVDIKDYPPDVLVPRYVRPDQLDDVLPQADVLFVSVPLTARTEGMIGEHEFGLMKKGSYFICVSRGKTYSMNGLVKALDEHRLAGAGVDVTNPEPLPPGHPLWQFPNVIITPHVANGSDRLDERMYSILRENLRRFSNGAPLLNVVDKQQGF